MDIKHNILSVFPKHVFCMDNVCIDELDNFASEIYDIVNDSGTSTNDLQHVKSTHRTNIDLHTYAVFEPLVVEIEKYSKEFARWLGYDDKYAFNLSIKNMWANVSDKGGYNFPHTHPGSIVSGAFYVKSNPENTIIFFDNYLNMEFPINCSGEGYDRVTFNCQAGRLLLFRGDFPHGNPPQLEDGEKIVISFNVVR